MSSLDSRYFIDGVEVSPRIYECRQLWGEHPAASFVMEARKKSERALRRERQSLIRREKLATHHHHDEKEEIWTTLHDATRDPRHNPRHNQ